MTWYGPFGISIFWVALIAAIIIYATKRKWYPIAFLISASIYVFTVGYVIDIFDLSRELILLSLAVSAALMIGAGFYLTKKARSQAPARPLPDTAKVKGK